MQGFQFAMSDLPIRSALLLLSVLSLFGLQYSVFLPIYANDILNGGARTLGLLMSFAGVGAVLGALQFAARTHYRGLARWIAATSLTCAVALIVFSRAQRFLAVRGRAVRSGLCGDIADGGDEYADSESRAG